MDNIAGVVSKDLALLDIQPSFISSLRSVNKKATNSAVFFLFSELSGIRIFVVCPCEQKINFNINAF